MWTVGSGSVLVDWTKSIQDWIGNELLRDGLVVSREWFCIFYEGGFKGCDWEVVGGNIWNEQK